MSALIKNVTGFVAISLGSLGLVSSAYAQRDDSITLYDGPNYTGQSVTIRREERNLQNRNFNDAASSFKVNGGRWEVCIDSNFNGSCQVVEEDLANMGAWRFNNRVSSVRRVRPDTNRRGRQRGVTLYSDPNFSGRSVDITEHTSSLVAYNFNDDARSIEVHSGNWTLCQHDDFRGRCETISGDISDLRRISLTAQITSLTPRDISTQNTGSSFDSGSFLITGGVTGFGSVFFPEPKIDGYPIAACTRTSGGRCGRSAAERLCRLDGFNRVAHYEVSQQSYASQSFFLEDRRFSQTQDHLVDVLCVR
jgi:hypothetical protein